MNLKELELPITIELPEENPYQLAIIPLLKKSILYKRGVAFFHSEWIDLAKDGLIDFVERGGKIQLLTSIKVGEDEYNAFMNGEIAKTDEILKRELYDKAVQSSKTSGKEWTLNYLSWLVCQEIAEVRISVHKKSLTSIFHDKISLFYDDSGNSVCIHGTLNDSENGLNNEESLSVFSEKNGTMNYLRKHESIFDKRWNGLGQNYTIVGLPDIVKLKFNELQSDFNPYKTLKLNDNAPKKRNIRDYQETAINALKNSGYRGILSMATGTGKTLTSLFAAEQIEKEYGHKIFCVVVPQITLIAQWIESINHQFNCPQVIVCAKNKTDWATPLSLLTITKSLNKTVFIVTTYDTLTDSLFKVKTLKLKEKLVYIFDECHKLGAPKTIREFKPFESTFRIGLSATPERWLDPKGSSFIENTIGHVVYEYSMEDAIHNKKLCPYNYNIVLCELNFDEMSEFIKYSKQIEKQSQIDKNSESLSDRMTTLLNNRARIAKTCESKWEAFFKEFDKYQSKQGTIVYVFDEQVERMIDDIKHRYPDLNVHGIIASTPADRRKSILAGFNNGDIDVLVAIQCLDEGVDVPNCHAEFILASSTNPREFIQRRGRVLRTSTINPEKIADIFDFVTIGNETGRLYGKEEKMGVIKRELPRVAEFVRLSKNKDDTILINYLYEIGGLEMYSKEEPWIKKDAIAEEDEDE